jgi:hypothetical protein
LLMVGESSIVRFDVTRFVPDDGRVTRRLSGGNELWTIGPDQLASLLAAGDHPEIDMSLVADDPRFLAAIWVWNGWTWTTLGGGGPVDGGRRPVLLLDRSRRPLRESRHRARSRADVPRGQRRSRSWRKRRIPRSGSSVGTPVASACSGRPQRTRADALARSSRGAYCSPVAPRRRGPSHRRFRCGPHLRSPR